MRRPSWPSDEELVKVRENVALLAECDYKDVKIVVSPYRICPLGAHIDHQGGTVSAMTINRGILLGFVPSGNSDVVLRSGQFKGEVRFRVDETQQPRSVNDRNALNHGKDLSKCSEECAWGMYARGALYALQRRGIQISQGITGFICGSQGLDSSGLSSSAAVGIAYLLALETANNVTVSPVENIEYDRLIENEYLGLKNGILDQSAILLSRIGCLTCMNCKGSPAAVLLKVIPPSLSMCNIFKFFLQLSMKSLYNLLWKGPLKASLQAMELDKTKEYSYVSLPKVVRDLDIKGQEDFKILLAFSGLKHALPSNAGYNSRVSECQEAARILLEASGKENLQPLLSNVSFDDYKAYKEKLDAALCRRAEHYFSENVRVSEGLKAWSLGNLEEFGKLVSESGLSSIQNYECGCTPLIQLYETILRAPGMLGTRFSGAGFRGCCLAFVAAEHAAEAVEFIRREYRLLQPELAAHLDDESAVLICDLGESARLI